MVSPWLVIKEFRKYGISNNLDGTDDALFDDATSSENETDEDDPHNDDVPVEFFDMLFNISHNNIDFHGF